jgi:hypothetical protein
MNSGVPLSIPQGLLSADFRDRHADVRVVGKVDEPALRRVLETPTKRGRGAVQGTPRCAAWHDRGYPE